MTDAAKQTIPVTTPCIGMCSTVFGDLICRGCKRYMDEIIAWNQYSDIEKTAVDARLSAHLAQILNAKFTLDDATLLAQQLQQHSVRYMKNRQPLCWVNDLLRTNVIETQAWSEFGVSVKPEYQALSIDQLRNLIDDELLTLSKAHYERYINV